MAEFLDDLGRMISDGAQVVAKKTGEVVEVVAKKTEQTIEIQKIKSKIRTMKKNNDRDYKDIGKMIYERFQKGEEVEEQFAELCEAIAEREEAIGKYKQDIADLKED